MPNIATLGLEFNSSQATKQIADLCQKFDELEKKSGSVQTAFSSLSKFKALDNTFVTQFAAIGNALNKFKAIDDTIATKISSITNAISTIQPISGSTVTSLAALADGLKKINFDANTSQTFNDISSLMTNLKPIDPAVSASLHQFVASVNNIKPVNPDVVQSIQALLAVSSAMPVGNTSQQELNTLALSLNKFKAIKPEIAISVRELFSAISLLRGIDASVVAGISGLGDATGKFKAIKPETVVSVNQLFSAIQFLPTIDQQQSDAINKIALATSQFKVIRPQVVDSVKSLLETLANIPNLDAQKSDAINKLALATAQFKVIRPAIAKSIDDLFKTIANIKNIPYNITDNVKRLGEGLAKFKKINPGVADSIRELFNTLNTIAPISAKMRMSIYQLTNLLNAMAAAGRNASGANRQLGQSMGYAATQTDGLSIAFRSLQGALSINFFKNAAAQAIEFGRELAFIKSIAYELDTVQIGKGIMNFSSTLGDPAENLKALYYAYSSGIRGSESDFIKFTEIVQKTAQVNRASIVPMADAMTAAMNAYDISVSQAGEVADNFFAIVKYGKASGEQLANSFGQVSPTAKTLGVTLDELGASIASLTKIQPTRVAITGLNNMLSKIMKPTKESRLALAKLGVDMSYSAVQSKGFVTVLREVREALNGDMEALKNIFPDIRGQRAAMHLLGAGWADFNRQLENFANKKGSMEAAFKVLAHDTSVQLGALPQTFKKIVTESGKMVSEFVTLGGVLTPTIAAFNNMDESARKLFAGITLVVGGYAAYKTAMFALQSIQAIQLKNEAAAAAMQTAKLAQLNAEIALRTKLAALSAVQAFSPTNTVSSVGRSGVGLGKSFAAMFNLATLKKQLVFLLHPIRSFSIGLKGLSSIFKGGWIKALSYAGAALGKVATFITGIFSVAALIKAGVVAIVGVGIDYLQSFIRTGKAWGEGSKSLTQSIMNGVVEFFTGAHKKVKQQDENFAKIKETFLQGKEFEGVASSIRKSFKNMLESFESVEDSPLVQIPGFIKNYNKALQNYYKDINQVDVDQAQDNYNSNQKKLLETQKRLLSDGTAREDLSSEEKKILEQAEKDYSDSLQKLQNLSKLAQKRRDAITTAGKNIINAYQQAISTLKKMQAQFQKDQLTNLPFVEQYKRYTDIFTQNLNSILRESNKERPDIKKMEGFYNDLYQAYNFFKNRLAENDKLFEDLNQLRFDGMMKGAMGDSAKRKLYNDDATHWMQESNKALKSKDFSRAYDYFNKSINASRQAAEFQNKLAQAEAQANRNTQQMILSLDKFKSSAMAVVNAGSTDARKLQAREFSSLPSFKPLTTQQDASNQLNQELSQKMIDFANKLQALIEREDQDTLTTTDKLQKYFEKNEQAVQNLQNQLANIVNNLKTGVKVQVTNMKGKNVPG